MREQKEEKGNGGGYFFCGIGGSGMSAIAQVLCARGVSVAGSDRNHDRGILTELYGSLKKQGIHLYPQDGSGITADTKALVVSTAVEDTVPDVAAAKKLGVPILHRAELLAQLVDEAQTIAVGGTSGKSTVTGMIGHILSATGRDPSVINGGIMNNAILPPLLGNAKPGKPDLLVIEADESDGTLARYTPAVSLITNVTLDHKPLEELRPLFSAFAKRAQLAAVINADCPECRQLPRGNGRYVTFSTQNSDADYIAEDLQTTIDGLSFSVNGCHVQMPQPGRHNASNAVAAIAATAELGVPVAESAAALGSFRGIHRRLEHVGTTNGIRVIDDFAHNPDKISASLSALRQSGRLLVMYQPHGFGPTRFLKDGLIQAFSEGMSTGDLLAMPEIYYAGGTAERSISSQDLLDGVAQAEIPTAYFEHRAPISDYLAEAAEPGDTIVVMGARDNTLADFSREILAKLSGEG